MGSGGQPRRSPTPPVVYEFWSSSDNRCLYVGKASRNPGDRIKSHFDQRKPWALEADWIRLHRLPENVPPQLLDLAEQQRIGMLTPRGNKQHNRGNYDALWARRVAVAHAELIGAPVGWRTSLGLVWGVVVQRVRWLGGRLVWSLAGGLVVALTMVLHSN